MWFFFFLVGMRGGGRKVNFFWIFVIFVCFFRIMYVRLSFKMGFLWNRHLMPVFHLAARKRFHVNGI